MSPERKQARQQATAIIERLGGLSTDEIIAWYAKATAAIAQVEREAAAADMARATVMLDAAASKVIRARAAI